MPASLRVALAGIVIVLAGAAAFAWAVLMIRGWDAIWCAVVGMGITLLGWIVTAVASLVSAVRNPPWRKGSLALLVFATAGIAFVFYVREHM